MPSSLLCVPAVQAVGRYDAGSMMASGGSVLGCANGWLDSAFIPETAEGSVFPIRAGAAGAGRSFTDLDITVAASAEVSEDIDGVARRHARGSAFTFGRHGSRTMNFKADASARRGYGEDVTAVQRLWLQREREAAAARAQLEIGRRTNLLGPGPTSSSGSTPSACSSTSSPG